jgi:hypothetical protein
MEQSSKAVPPPDESAVPAYPSWETRPRRLPAQFLPRTTKRERRPLHRPLPILRHLLDVCRSERDTPTLVDRRDAIAERGPMSNWTRMIWTLVAVAAVLTVVVVLVIVLRK